MVDVTCVPTRAPCGLPRIWRLSSLTSSDEFFAIGARLESRALRQPAGENGWPTSVSRSIQAL
jgi:hypothetical protein